MFLDYFALGLMFFVFITIFYAIIAIHDIPYEIAKHRDHPHQDAIHAAGWVSLFTLHAIVAVLVDLGDDLPPRSRLGLRRGEHPPRPAGDAEARLRGSRSAWPCSSRRLAQARAA